MNAQATSASNRWSRIRLADAAEFLDYRRRPINESERRKRIEGKSVSELHPYYGANGQVGWIDEFLFDEPLILLAEDGGNFGSHTKPVAYAVSGKYWVNNHAHCLRPKNGVSFEFLRHALSIRPDIGRLVSGSTRGKLNQETAAKIEILLPSLSEQERIAGRLTAQMAEVERARAAAAERFAAAQALPAAYLREAFAKVPPGNGTGCLRMLPADECLIEVTKGVGSQWRGLPLYGATRAGLAEAKEPVGKHPERYKPVEPGTVFYNPMRILLQSIAMVDDGDAAGMTSPDYVVVRGRPGVLHHRVFYYWLRSLAGDTFIRQLARGGVRERILFSRLCEGRIPVLPWSVQEKIAERIAAIPWLAATLREELAALDAIPAALLREAFGHGGGDE